MSQLQQRHPMGRTPEIDPDTQTIRATRTLRTAGGSYVVTIPPEILDSVSFAEGDDIEIRAEMFGDEIQLVKAEPAGDDSDDAEADGSDTDE